jgi:hypothetical protein
MLTLLNVGRAELTPLQIHAIPLNNQRPNKQYIKYYISD